MLRISLILFIAFELCYYLLIAQTGIVECFSSDIFQIAPLPIGGMLGSLLSYKVKLRYKTQLFLFLQLILSFFYPHFSFILLFLLGLSVGTIAPLMINELKKTSNLELGVALCLSYCLGTFLFDYDPALRKEMGVLFTLVVLSASFRIEKIAAIKALETYSYPLLSMILWVFLDSALFETLSRDTFISIWRGGYTFEIMVFHVLGVITAFQINVKKCENELFIMSLFGLSYLLYFLHEALLLASVYPFVISYYNISILKTLQHKSLKQLSLYMFFIGWVASGFGLFVALNQLLLFVPLIAFIVFVITINFHKTITFKETKCLN